MSAARITIEGGAVEVAARFETEGEIDAFFVELWHVWFATHREGEADAVALPALPASPAPAAPAVHDGNAEQPRVDARQECSSLAGHDAPKVDEAAQDDAAQTGDSGDQAAAFASLTPTQRRAVLLKRKLGKTSAVAAEMGVSGSAVSQHLGAARAKGVAI